MNKVTDHHEPSSCHSHIFWQEVPNPWNLAGQVAVSQGPAHRCREETQLSGRAGHLEGSAEPGGDSRSVQSEVKGPGGS